MALLLGVSCSDWTETENIESTVLKPWEQDPALWADYTAALRAYKASAHYLSYVRLHNSPSPASSEQDFMRCLPDSLDIVALTNADNFSAYDTEDMATMREKGTRVLYQVDYAARKAEFSGEAALKTYLDGVIAAVKANGMDGYSFTADPLDAAATAAMPSNIPGIPVSIPIFRYSLNANSGHPATFITVSDLSPSLKYASWALP